MKKRQIILYLDVPNLPLHISIRRLVSALKDKIEVPEKWYEHKLQTVTENEEVSILCLPLCRYLTIIPRAQMGSESIAHEAEGRMGY